MDFSLIIKLFPLIIKAVGVAQDVLAASKSGASVVALIEQKGPGVVDLIQQVGASLFPGLTRDEQIQAGAGTFNPALTKTIQAQLNSLGSALVADGVYGALTKAAVTAFQTKSGLDADGWAGPVTQAALTKAVAGFAAAPTVAANV